MIEFMANEWTLFTRYENPISMTVADGTTIEKGTLLKITDPNTAIAHSAALDNIAGVAACEKIASNGETTLAVYRRGRFKATISGSVTVGDALIADAVANMVKSATASSNGLSGSKIIGRSLETATTGETILLELEVTALGSQ